MSNLLFLTVSKRRMRAFALAMAVALTLFMVAAAGHRHEHAETHPCAVCTVLLDELPTFDALPPLLQGRTAHAYALAAPASAYVCLYRPALLLPPSCGPPVNLAAL
ncbi:hypothetical protein [Massilia sp. 9096]|jgi:hypothetical protein|uniref:hypothetical protein n=1 Tax=Massilia sp. 9096 TaxID=1500894 RepID=UPI000569028D|nr:hypothetical protein [Massilia sp. 9096]